MGRATGFKEFKDAKILKRIAQKGFAYPRKVPDLGAVNLGDNAIVSKKVLQQFHRTRSDPSPVRATAPSFSLQEYIDYEHNQATSSACAPVLKPRMPPPRAIPVFTPTVMPVTTVSPPPPAESIPSPASTEDEETKCSVSEAASVQEEEDADFSAPKSPVSESSLKLEELSETDTETQGTMALPVKTEDAPIPKTANPFGVVIDPARPAFFPKSASPFGMVIDPSMPVPSVSMPVRPLLWGTDSQGNPLPAALEAMQLQTVDQITAFIQRNRSDGKFDRQCLVAATNALCDLCNAPVRSPFKLDANLKAHI